MGMWQRLVIASLAVTAALPAQPAGVIDEATFTLTKAGKPFGTETFKTSRRLGAEGVEYVTQSTRTIEGRILRTMLTSDSAGNPTIYMRAWTDAASGQITARRAMNRLTVNEEGPQGSSRDYVFAPGMLIFDEEVIHPLYFVTWREPRDIGYVDPAAKTTGRASLTEVGRESLMVGNTAVPAMRFSLGSGDSRREIWVDSERRLLKVSHPATQVVGMRDLPPR